MKHLQQCADELAKILTRRQLSIAAAESVTAGKIQAAFSLAENAAAFFQGGITTYNIGQKCRQLDVDPILALSCNAVSQKVADQMAINVCRKFLSDIGVAITGYAAPYPLAAVKDLYAYFSIAMQGQIIWSKKIEAEKNTASQVQDFYTYHVLQVLNDVLLKK